MSASWHAKQSTNIAFYKLAVSELLKKDKISAAYVRGYYEHVLKADLPVKKLTSASDWLVILKDLRQLKGA